MIQDYQEFRLDPVIPLALVVLVILPVQHLLDLPLVQGHPELQEPQDLPWLPAVHSVQGFPHLRLVLTGHVVPGSLVFRLCLDCRLVLGHQLVLGPLTDRCHLLFLECQQVRPILMPLVCLLHRQAQELPVYLVTLYYQQDPWTLEVLALQGSQVSLHLLGYQQTL